MNIILDYDGTIHNTIKIYAPAFRKAYHYLRSKNLAPNRDFSDDEISKYLGYSPKDMWDIFMPHLKSNEKEYCINLIGNEMNNLLKKEKAELYPNALSTLDSLKKEKHNLIFLSNCTHDYMESNRKIFKLDKYYKGFYCSEDFKNAQKPEIFLKIKKDFDGDFLIVGDRFKDIEIAKIHGLISIGCAYGFGNIEELKDADYIINKLEELLNIVNAIDEKA